MLFNIVSFIWFIFLSIYYRPGPFKLLISLFIFIVIFYNSIHYYCIYILSILPSFASCSSCAGCPCCPFNPATYNPQELVIQMVFRQGKSFSQKCKQFFLEKSWTLTCVWLGSDLFFVLFCFLNICMCLWVWVFCSHVGMCPTCTTGTQRGQEKEGIRTPGAGVTEGCNLSCWCWEPNPGPLPKTSEPSLQPHYEASCLSYCCFHEEALWPRQLREGSI